MLQSLLRRLTRLGAAPRPAAVRARRRGYPGDFPGMPRMEYRPDPNGLADPGEVVWGWVPFEEDHRRGKDRPVLIIGMDGRYLLGLMLTSKDHDRDADAEARHGRRWMDIGTGGWDSQRRPSEVRLDRIIRLQPSEVRREGAALPRRTFDQVAAGVRAARPNAAAAGAPRRPHRLRRTRPADRRSPAA